MELDPSFQDQFHQFPYFSTLFPENPCSEPQIPTTMFPSHTSTSIPPPQNNSSLHVLNNNSTNGEVLWDSSQKTTTIPTHHTTPSHPSPPPIYGGHGSMVRIGIKKEPQRIKENVQRANNNGDGKIKRQRKRVKVQNDGNNIDNMIKGQWSPDEDRVLKELVDEHGMKKWSEIAKSLDGRIGKQCRERWYNHLQPNIKKGPWTQEEDNILIKGHQEVGNKWTEIAKRLPGRTDNSIKNRWNATKRRRDTKTPKTNTNNTSDGSQLQAYIKEVTAVEEEEAPKKLNNESNKVKDKIFNSCDTNNIGHMLRLVFPNHDFSNEAWAAKLLDTPI